MGDGRVLTVGGKFVTLRAYSGRLMKRILSLGMLTFAAGLFVFAFAGCENGDGTTGLAISPQQTSLTTSNNSVVLTVSSNAVGDLGLPLTWTVSDPSLGNVIGQGGYSAVYTRTSKNGSNVITVQDQMGAQGVAVMDNF